MAKGTVISAMDEEYAVGKKRRRPRKFLLVLLILAAVVLAFGIAIWMLSDNDTLETTFYQVTSGKIQEPVRFVLLTDLHNHEFGRANHDLVDEIESLEPDLIVMAGDMVNGNDANITIVTDLCGKLLDMAPVYYVFGNNEGALEYGDGGPKVALDAELWKKGVTVLYNNSISAEIKENPFEIMGVTAAEDEFEKVAGDAISSFEKKDGFKLLLTHFPSLYYDCLADVDFDLGVAGHFHGGQIRLPDGRGLFHVDEGFFPQYCYGEFSLTHGTLIVSRGLGGHGHLPRINNRPELVVIDISRS